MMVAPYDYGCDVCARYIKGNYVVLVLASTGNLLYLTCKISYFACKVSYLACKVSYQAIVVEYL